jgi:8-oxo-dGTP pyrophosphatase MutT (NUDIX family)
LACEFITVYAGERAPESWDAAVILAGNGTGRQAGGPAPWRPAAVAALAGRWEGDGRLVVFVPEGRDGGRADGAAEASWAETAHGLADAVLSWQPGGPDGGSYLAGPPGSNDLAEGSLDAAVRAVLAGIGEGAHRSGSERAVPLLVWRTDSFQRWFAAQRAAGNTMLGARPVWTFSPGPASSPPFYWALHVRMHVLAENRVKSNEVVISRPDISAMVLYRRADTLDEATVVLVREFRSPARTPDGFVHELPSGSGAGPASALGQAVDEVREETGLTVDAARVRALGSRQLSGTMSAHHAHLFAAEITGGELAGLRAAQSRPHGADSNELTWIQIATFGEIRRAREVDWATLGMIAEALLGL